MMYQDSPGERAGNASPGAPGRRLWKRQRLAQGIWMVLAFLFLVLFVVNLPAFFQYARTVCTLPDAGNCPVEQFTPAYVQILHQLHLPIVVAENFLAVLCVVVAVFYWLLGLLIFWRKSQEWVGLLVSLLLVLFGSTVLLGFNLPVQTPPFFQLLAQIITYGLAWPATLFFFFTFPTGRFTPRWTLAVFVPVFVIIMLTSIPATAHFIPGGISFLINLPPLGIWIYRYVRVYDTVQRQQTKWFVFGLSIIFFLVFVQGLLQTLPTNPGEANVWYQLFNGPFWLLPWTVVLLGVSIPILQYRLWDIDIIINRTLVYGSLTALLALFYFSLIFALQSLFRVIINQNNNIVIVISTLAIALLVQPLRHRLQAGIDRRFYRRKYDASRTLAAFSATVRDEVDLQQLTEKLLIAVQETMQPAHVSLWLCEPVQPGSEQIQSNEVI